MANYAELIADINAKVYENTEQKITGTELNSVLLNMVSQLGAGYAYVGKASPTTTPIVTDAKVYYVAVDEGDYDNFGEGFSLKSGQIGVFYYDTAWHLSVFDVCKDYAKKDGYYEQMGVGYAKSLLGNGAATQETIDFRPSGGTKDIGTGVETLKAIKGNSVVWNQLVDDIGYNKPAILVSSGNGLFKLNGTEAIDIYYQNITSTYGRKYYFYVGLLEGSCDTSLISSENLDLQDKRIGIPRIITLTSGSYPVIRSTEQEFTNALFCIQWIDLTQMFGAGNEPTTTDDPRIKWLESFGYIPYNEGTLLNFKGEGLKTVGVNAFDGTKAKVLGGVAYRILGTYTTLKFAETIDGAQTDITPSSGLYTPPTNGYIFATGVSNEFQIAIEHSGGDIPNTYHPYEEHTLALPITSLKANGVTIFPDGMKSAGTAKDELYGNSLGVITKARKRIGVVDLGTLDWFKDSLLGKDVFKVYINGGIATPLGANLRCARYTNVPSDGSVVDVDRRISGTFVASPNYECQICIYDTLYASGTAEAFKTAMQGVMLYYELATPEEYTLDTPINTTTYVNDWGTEQNLPQGVDAQGLPKTTPLNAEIVYAPNVQDAIRNLPKNYIGKESMDAILEAFKTAGIIASFTLTYDATSGKYNCSITKQS